ncbi:MAG TPA: hypothetical protein VK703_05390 [Candidatus Acidoferrales bacterium]|jgi:hypothetical protein|nr:hypothetical protein [Candidatus Acidoferrales bacterium]
MSLFRVVLVASLLVTAIPRQAEAGVGAKSVQRLFSPEECEAIPELLGAWTASGVNYSIQQGRGKNYRMVDRDADSRTGSKLVLEICVAHINGQLFYDATFQILNTSDTPTLPPEFVVGSGVFAVDVVAGYWVPMHILGKLEIKKNALHFRNIDDEWLQGSLNAKLVTVSSAQDDSGEYFLTANSKQLKALMASLSSNPKAFSSQQDLSRALKPTQK